MIPGETEAGKGREAEIFWRKHQKRDSPSSSIPQVQKEISGDRMGWEEALGFWEWQRMPHAPERASKEVASGGVGCPREAETWAPGFSSDSSEPEQQRGPLWWGSARSWPGLLTDDHRGLYTPGDSTALGQPKVNVVPVVHPPPHCLFLESFERSGDPPRVHA